MKISPQPLPSSDIKSTNCSAKHQGTTFSAVKDLIKALDALCSAHPVRNQCPLVLHTKPFPNITISCEKSRNPPKKPSKSCERYLLKTYLMVQSVAEAKGADKKSRDSLPQSGPLSWLQKKLGWGNSPCLNAQNKCWCHHIPSEEVSSAFRAVGNIMLKEEKYDKALVAANNEILVKRITLGSSHSDVGRTLNRLVPICPI